MKLFFIFIGLLLVFGCKQGPAGPSGLDGKDGAVDKQIRFDLEWSANTQSTDWIKGIALIKFNKMNYPGVDSIIFVASLISNNEANNVIAELTVDEMPIEGSRLILNKSGTALLESKNIYNQLPDREDTLYIRLKGTVGGAFTGLNKSYLFLYRK